MVIFMTENVLFYFPSPQRELDGSEVRTERQINAAAGIQNVHMRNATVWDKRKRTVY